MKYERQNSEENFPADVVHAYSKLRLQPMPYGFLEYRDGTPFACALGALGLAASVDPDPRTLENWAENKFGSRWITMAMGYADALLQERPLQWWPSGYELGFKAGVMMREEGIDKVLVAPQNGSNMLPYEVRHEENGRTDYGGKGHPTPERALGSVDLQNGSWDEIPALEAQTVLCNRTRG